MYVITRPIISFPSPIINLEKYLFQNCSTISIPRIHFSDFKLICSNSNLLLHIPYTTAHHGWFFSEQWRIRRKELKAGTNRRFHACRVAACKIVEAKFASVTITRRDAVAEWNKGVRASRNCSIRAHDNNETRRAEFRGVVSRWKKKERATRYTHERVAGNYPRCIVAKIERFLRVKYGVPYNWWCNWVEGDSACKNNSKRKNFSFVILEFENFMIGYEWIIGKLFYKWKA